MKAWLRRTWPWFYCLIFGCEFNALDVNCYALHFCTNGCGAEIAGRSFDDLVPMDDEAWIEMDRRLSLGEERTW